MHLAAPLDHESSHAPGAEVLAEITHPDPVASVDHGGDFPEPRAGVDYARTHAVHELLGVAGGEEVGARVQPHPLGHGDLDGRRWEPASRPGLAALRRA